MLHDTVEMLGSSLFALTVNCARCHSHKFDPIPQRDYYRLMALFTPAYNPQHWKPVFPWKPGIKDRAIADVAPAEQAQIEQANLAVDRDLAAMHNRMSEPHCTPELKAKLKQRIAERSAARRQFGHIQALYDVGPAPATYLLKRGQFENPGPEVEPGFLSVLCDADREAVAQPHANGPDSGRRLAFARWLTHQDSRAAALVARVMVNRIWQHLFGQGLVRTPENFGAQGETPTHPELLEWLAADFMTTYQWQMKPLIRELVLSAAYQQSSAVGQAASLPRLRTFPTRTSSPMPAKLDPENKLLWRMPAKRLEAEVIRDCILATSGRLNSVMGGPPILLVARPDGLVVVDESKLKRPADANKRSVYLLSRRAYNLSLLTVFDRPLFAVNCPKRDASVIPLQSLTMLNDEFVADEAVHFAARVARECIADKYRRNPPRLLDRALPAPQPQRRNSLHGLPRPPADGLQDGGHLRPRSQPPGPHRTLPHAPQHERVPVRRMKNTKTQKDCNTKSPSRRSAVAGHQGKTKKDLFNRRKRRQQRREDRNFSLLPPHLLFNFLVFRISFRVPPRRYSTWCFGGKNCLHSGSVKTC